MTLTAATRLAAVVGRPIRHSLSPVLHNAWLETAGLDGAYVALSVSEGRFAAFVEAFRGGSLAGVNVTLPFKTEALAAADLASERAQEAGAANLLLFDPDGRVRADNTDGEGLLYAFARQAPDFRPDREHIARDGFHPGPAAYAAWAAAVAREIDRLVPVTGRSPA